MTARRTNLLIFTLAMASTSSCTALANKSSPSIDVSSARPRERMGATRRREGSDVTTREGRDRGWFVGLGLPCDAGDSASVKPAFDRKCEGTDPSGEIDRTPKDTTTQKLP